MEATGRGDAPGDAGGLHERDKLDVDDSAASLAVSLAVSLLSEEEAARGRPCLLLGGDVCETMSGTVDISIDISTLIEALELG